MATWKVAPALAAGCAAILKPFELASVTCLELADICKEVGLPSCILNILFMYNRLEINLSKMKRIGIDTEALKKHFGKKIMKLEEEKRKVQEAVKIRNEDSKQFLKHERFLLQLSNCRSPSQRRRNGADIRSVISSVQRVAMAISPSGINSAVGSKLSPGSPEALTLANWICCSYSYYLGAELLRSDSLISESVLKHLWHHQDAILCCSLKSVPVFIFANQAGLDMLKTTLVALKDIT
nr:uncharacterized protein LOC112742636 [Arachis hypogaea]